MGSEAMSVDAFEGTTFGVARLAGIAEKGPGCQYEVWYPDLQLANVISCLAHLTYTDERGPRLPVHVILGGKKGKGKTSAINAFVKTVMGAIEIGSYGDVDVRPNAPTYLTLGGKGTVTYERLRGTLNKDGLVFPLLKRLDFLVAPELTSFVDEPAMINVMAQTIEEADITIAQIQGAQYDPSEEEIMDWRSRGLSYNEQDHILSYKATATLIGATRDLDEKTTRFLNDSGFNDRTLISKYQPDKEQARRSWERRRTTMAGKDYFDALAAFSLKARKSSPLQCPTPPEKYFDEVLSVMKPVFEEVEDSMGIDPDDFRTDRDHNIVYQALTGACFERTVRESKIAGTLPTLRYEVADVEVAKVFALRHAIQKRNEWIGGVVREKRIREAVVHEDIIQSREDEDLFKLKKKYPQKEFTAKEAMLTLGKKRRATYLSLDSLMRRGFLIRPKYGYYAIKE